MNLEKELTRREAIQGLLGAAVTAVTPIHAYPEEGQKQRRNPWPQAMTEFAGRLKPFNDSWRFHRGNVEEASSGEYDDSGWRTVNVPHDWSIEDVVKKSESIPGAIWATESKPVRIGPFDLYASEGQTATGWTVGGIGWYRKGFDKPRIPDGGNMELRFEGIYMNSDVWINGTHLGNHPYGYTEFAYDLTKYLRNGTNCIAVRVNNAGRNSRWYSGSGIVRKVWLSIGGEVSIPTHGVFVTTREASVEAALVMVETTVENRAPMPKKLSVRVQFVDSQGVAGGESEQHVTIPTGSNAVAECPVRLKHPRLWSPQCPHLYRVEVVVEDGSKVVDATTVQVGIRKVDIGPVQGLQINGEDVKLRGGCVHIDNGPLGSVCIPRAEERRLEILKANGYNAIRTSHNPPSRSFLDACDRMGMLVIDEAFDGWEEAKNPEDYHLYFKDWWQRDLESMILRDRNHPSVILWSIGNEMKERAEPHGVEIGKQLAAVVHKFDPTRKVTAAICEPYDHPKQTWDDMQPAFTYLDVAGYNYRLDKYESDHAKYPTRVMVGTESYPGAAYQNWKFIENANWVIGDFVWTAVDYIGESGLGSTGIRKEPGRSGGLQPYPWFNSYCGDIDLIGNKKPQSYFRDIVWRRSKVEMAVQRPLPKEWSEYSGQWGWSDELRSWTWPGFEGSPLSVRVYTRAQHVKLFLNGREIGSQDLGESNMLKAEFAVPYEPGELKAVVYDGGSETGVIRFSTAGRAHKLIITPDRLKLTTDGDDLGYVMLTVVDEAGRPIPDAVVPVTFSVDGAAEILGVGNANPKDVASFQQPYRDTYHGECLLVVRPRREPGKIMIRAESAGLLPGTAELETVST